MGNKVFPSEGGFDNTLSFLSEGYEFISRRCKKYNTDAFETKIMFKKAVCVTGEDASKMFYHPGRFTRKGAIPITTVKLLQDKGSVQSLDDEEHRNRKKMFMMLMSQKSIQKLVAISVEEWDKAIDKWSKMDKVILYDEVREILCRSVCRWTETPFTEAEIKDRTEELGFMISAAGRVGPKNIKAIMLRKRTEQWAKDIVEKVRKREVKVSPESALSIISFHGDLDGQYLESKIAAVELINILRPTVAVTRYILFTALAFHDHPESIERVIEDEDDYTELFTKEIRRFYPFFPIIAGIARESFEWQDYPFTKGSWVILDIYGTNHDERTWDKPYEFIPERFRTWPQNAYNFIPQGGGDYNTNHRCPGEMIAIELTKAAAKILAGSISYDVPEQDLSIKMSKMPARPASGFVISNVKRV